MLEEFLGRTSCQPHLAWAPQFVTFVTWEGEGEGNKTRRRIVVGHWFCQVRGNYASAAAADGALRRQRRRTKANPRREPPASPFALAACHVSRDTKIALELQRKVEIGVIM